MPIGKSKIKLATPNTAIVMSNENPSKLPITTAIPDLVPFRTDVVSAKTAFGPGQNDIAQQAINSRNHVCMFINFSSQ